MSDDESGAYEVKLSLAAEATLKSVGSKADLRALDHLLHPLDTVPSIGYRYDPIYDAAMPEIPVFVVYAGHYGIYYDVDDAQKSVDVLFIEDQRKDPLRRFRDR